MTQYKTSDWSTSDKELIRVSKESTLSVTRICDFCEHPYKTPDVKVKASAMGQSNAMSKWMKGDAKSKADEKYAIKERKTTMWLLRGEGNALIGALCPNCQQFSTALVEKHFKEGEDQFLRDKFLTYAYFGMWWKVIFVVASLIVLLLGVLFNTIGVTFISLVVIGVGLHFKFKLFSRFDQVYAFVNNVQVIKFQACITQENAALMLKDIYIDSGMKEFKSSKVFDTVMGLFLHMKQTGLQPENKGS